MSHIRGPHPNTVICKPSSIATLPPPVSSPAEKCRSKGWLPRPPSNIHEHPKVCATSSQPDPRTAPHGGTAASAQALTGVLYSRGPRRPQSRGPSDGPASRALGHKGRTGRPQHVAASAGRPRQRHASAREGLALLPQTTRNTSNNVRNVCLQTLDNRQCRIVNPQRKKGERKKKSKKKEKSICMT